MQDMILTPARIATSKPAQRTYLNTLLITIASTILLGIAVLAYATFYWNYIPRIGIERVVHLQYGSGPNPFGVVNLDKELVQQQQYDISLSLHVPRSPRNIEKGNFMVSVNLLRESYIPPPAPSQQRSAPLLSALTSNVDVITAIKKEDVITTLRRTAILTYSSRLVSLSSRLLGLPLYLVGLRKESEVLDIQLAELLMFEGRGRGNVPTYAVVEVEAGQEVQIYTVLLKFQARFGGLRWWMYNHRFISAAIGISMFWFAEVVFTLISWLIIKSFFTQPTSSKSSKSIKDESDFDKPIKTEPGAEEETKFSDTERTFPTYGRNKKPLKWESENASSPETRNIKQEGQDQDQLLEEVHIQPLDADDEDEEDDGVGSFKDSGLGTSYSDAGRGGDRLGTNGKGRRRKAGRGDGDV